MTNRDLNRLEDELEHFRRLRNAAHARGDRKEALRLNEHVLKLNQRIARLEQYDD